MKITVISTYPPRQCGLATFTQNLIQAIKANCTTSGFDFQIVAIEKKERLTYPPEVRYQINEATYQDYISTAESINADGTDLCLLQHEFGIFGGESGLYVLSLVHALKVPVIVTLHTVLNHPSFIQKSITRSLARKTEKLVVMSNTGASFLQDIYEIPREKILVIEHGVPEMGEDMSSLYTNKYLPTERRILLTFGLLSRNKGIDLAIRALPNVVKKHPNILYLILGKTHPNVLKESGENYRNYLKQLVRKHKLEKHVCFLNQFVSEAELVQYLKACDIYITPYMNEAQITSGTLSYAVGAGAAVVSTPYWHAKELLHQGRGCLFDFGDIDQLSKIIIDLLDHPDKLNAIKAKAFAHGKNFQWAKVGHRYLEQIMSTVDNFSVPNHPVSAWEISSPEPEFDHLKRLTDNTGIIQHAKFGVPNLKEGYCLDDNSRALLAATMAYRISGFEDALNLIPIYLGYINYMQNASGTFRNFLSFDKQFQDEEGSEDAFGRTLWALGYLIKNLPNSTYGQLAEEILVKASEHFKNLDHNRAIANTIIGMCYYLRQRPDNDKMERLLVEMTHKLIDRYYQYRNNDWDWFENQLSYDNGILPLALWHMVKITGSKEVRSVAERTTSFLDRVTLNKGYLAPVGSNGWYPKDNQPAQFAQQPTDVMAMVLLNYQAYLVSGKSGYIQNMHQCYQWFFGENDLKIPLYDDETHGCCDGLEQGWVNRNQGAESTLAYLISNLTVSQLTREEIESIEPRDRVGSKRVPEMVKG